MFEKFAKLYRLARTEQERAVVIEDFAKTAIDSGSSLGSYQDLLAAGGFMLMSIAARMTNDEA